MPNRLWLTFLVLLGAGACSTITDNHQQGCDICTTGAYVYGRVTTTAGTPVANARVAVDIHLESCTSVLYGSVGSDGISNADGNYRAFARSISGEGNACLVVIATPPVSSGATVTADTGGVVRLRSADVYPHLFDSVRVDIAVRPLP